MSWKCCAAWVVLVGVGSSMVLEVEVEEEEEGEGGEVVVLELEVMELLVILEECHMTFWVLFGVEIHQ